MILTKDHQKLLSRWLNEYISRKLHLVYIVVVSVKQGKKNDFVFYWNFNDVNQMYFSWYAIFQPSWKWLLMILAKYQSIWAVFVGSSGAVQFLKINMKNLPKYSYLPTLNFCDASRHRKRNIFIKDDVHSLHWKK